jgi:hypothetical protein
VVLLLSNLAYWQLNWADHHDISGMSLTKVFSSIDKCQRRSLVANSEDALQIPLLVYANMAWVLHLVKSVNFRGAIIISSDCTKVCARLAYSTDFGSHILGSVLPLEECKVDDTEDIDKVIAEIKAKKAIASQTRAIIVKVST